MNVRSYLGAVLTLVLLAGLVYVAVAQEGATDRRSQVKGGRDYLPSQETERVDTLAWVGGKAITRQDLESRLDELAPNARSQFETPDGRRQLLNYQFRNYRFRNYEQHAHRRAGAPAPADAGG